MSPLGLTLDVSAQNRRRVSIYLNNYLLASGEGETFREAASIVVGRVADLRADLQELLIATGLINAAGAA